MDGMREYRASAAIVVAYAIVMMVGVGLSQ